MAVFENTLFHTAIIGGGAAGLFCAGSFSARKIVLEANAQLAQKVRVSGGGKCNFSNTQVTATDYLSQHPHFCKSALAAFKPADFTALLDSENIPWQERASGRLFANTADDIAKFLIKRAQRANTQIACSVRVLDVLPEKDAFVLHTSAGTLRSRNVVLATGGLSFPSLGASPFGWQLARRLGLQVLEPTPVLCGLNFPKEKRLLFSTLAGNSTLAKIRCGKHIFIDQLLFTHDGISGPVVLQISLFWKPGQEVEIDFLPQHSCREIFRQHKTSNQPMSAILRPFFPGKIAKILLQGSDVSLANASRAQLEAACDILHHFRFIPTGTAGYTKAEATAGGVDTKELVASTLEARKIPGLYVIGELVDVTGRLGGFNLQWAWSSAFVTACDLAKKF